MTPLAARSQGERTLPEQIEHALTLEILRGDRPAGSRLPSLRTLARSWETTLPTIQRVIERLAARGLVDARRGSGVIVLDVERTGGLSLYPIWFEALASDPRAAAGLLEDFFEVRRVVMVHLLTRHRSAVAAAASTLLAHVHTLTGLSGGVAERAKADLALSRALVDAVGNRALKAVFNTVESLVTRTPWIAEAFYGEPAAHQEMLTSLAAELLAKGSPEPRRLEEAVGRFDARAVQRFRELLEEAS